MKKTSKKLFVMLICLVLILGAMAVNALAAEEIASGECGKDAEWILTDDGTLTVSGEGKINDYNIQQSPWYANRLAIRKIVIEDGITEIGEWAFIECINAESVSIPDSVTEIGACAFEDCLSLTEVRISENIEFLGYSAFAGCAQLEKFSIDEDNLEYVTDEYGVIYSRDKTILRQAPGKLSGEYTIPPTVEIIDDGAFKYCKELTGVVMPESVAWISTGAFYGSGITSIVIPDSVSEMDGYVFTNCKNLTSVTLSKNIDRIYSQSFIGCTSLTGIVIPEGVKKIDDEAFKDCTSLTDVIIPATVTEIGDEVFMDCASLQGITIPAAVTKIGYYAFNGCTSLTAFNVDEENPNYSNDENGVLFNKDKSKLIKVPGGMTGIYTIPANTSIDTDAFDGCTSITSVEFPENIRGIQASLFENCTGITNITLPDNFVEIGNFAFSGCISLESINIPKNVTNIGYCAFNGCTSLTGVWVDEDNEYYSSDENGVLYNKNKTELWYVPGTMMGTLSISKDVEFIEEHAFYGCVKLAGVAVDKDNPYFCSDENGVLFDKEKTMLLFAPKTLSGSYTVPKGVSRIGAGAFSNCTEVTEVILPDSVTRINNYAFENCTGLKNIIIPENIFLMLHDVFRGCTELSEIRFVGNMPSGISVNIFRDIATNVYYPINNYTWNYTNMKSFGDDVTWIAYTSDVPPVKKGDVNKDGDITNADLVMVARYIVDLYDAESEEAVIIEELGDMDESGDVTNADLIEVARIIVGLD